MTIQTTVPYKGFAYICLDLSREARGDGIALQLAVGRQQAIFNRKRLFRRMKRANLPVVGQCSVQPFQLRIDFRSVTSPVTIAAKKAAAVANQHDLLRAAKARRSSSSMGSGAMLWPEFRMIRFFSLPVMRQFPFASTSP